MRQSRLRNFYRTYVVPIVAHREAEQSQRRRRNVFLLGIGAFAASVTIASIPALNAEALGEASSIIALSPPQTVIPASDFAPPADLQPGLVSYPFTLDDASMSTDVRSSEVVVRAGESLAGILRREGHDVPEILQAVQNNPEARSLYRLVPGQQLIIRTDTAGQLQELVQRVQPYESLRLTRALRGFEVTREKRDYEVRLAYVTGSIERSLFEDGQEAGLSDPLILYLAEIFGWDIDFALDLRHGDSFAVVHEEKYWLGQKIADGDILAAEFINQGRVYRAIGYRDENGSIEYYTPEGVTLRRAFLRTPVKFSRVSSAFTNSRYHPILKSWRAHKGVDYAAPTGTPVRATGSGRIVSVGWNGGYGNTVVIRHRGAYSTLYAHLSRYRAGLRAGQDIKQGEIIGFVGQTGLASGPHLHYELQVDGVHQNPLTFVFPGEDHVASDVTAGFLQAVAGWNAKLDLIGGSRLVLSQ